MASILANLRKRVIAHPSTIAALGLACKAIYDATTQDYPSAIQDGLAALGLLGVHLSLAAPTVPPTPPAVAA